MTSNLNIWLCQVLVKGWILKKSRVRKLVITQTRVVHNINASSSAHDFFLLPKFSYPCPTAGGMYLKCTQVLIPLTAVILFSKCDQFLFYCPFSITKHYNIEIQLPSIAQSTG